MNLLKAPTPAKVKTQNTAARLAVAKSPFYTGDEQRIRRLLAQNRSHDGLYKASLKNELLHFMKFALPMLSAFPVGLYMRNRIRKNNRLNHILRFKALQSVRSNIEKGSFAYDTLLFKQKPWQLLKNKSHLANLVCLAILFGDEFLDGLATTCGKHYIQTLISNTNADYYLHSKNTNDSCSLYYAFDICDILPAEALRATNDKYGISYADFYQHLQFLLTEMNSYLAGLPAEKAAEAAALICTACNRCFDTYRCDITAFSPTYSLPELMRYQQSKDDDIIQVLLSLRAVLLGKKSVSIQKRFSSWALMVRGMQLYDDMQDVAADSDFQMNILCYFAHTHFKQEWHWLQQNKDSLKHIQGLRLHSTICLYMPGSCMLTMQYARQLAHTKLDWVQRKIQNYLWRKNWLGFNNAMLQPQGFCLTGKAGEALTIVEKLCMIRQQVFNVEHWFVSENMKWSFIADVLLMDALLKRSFLEHLSGSERYFIITSFIEYPLDKKAVLVKRFFASFKQVTGILDSGCNQAALPVAV